MITDISTYLDNINKNITDNIIETEKNIDLLNKESHNLKNKLFILHGQYINIFELIPTPLIHLICKYLSKENVVSFGVTSKKIHNIVQKYQISHYYLSGYKIFSRSETIETIINPYMTKFKKIRFQNFSGNKKCHEIVHIGKNIYKIKLDSLSVPSSASSTYNLCENITNIKMCTSTSWISDHELILMNKYFPNLKKIVIGVNTFHDSNRESTSMFPNVTTLVFKKQLSVLETKKIVVFFPNLNKLIIDNTVYGSKNEINQFISSNI